MPFVGRRIRRCINATASSNGLDDLKFKYTKLIAKTMNELVLVHSYFLAKIRCSLERTISVAGLWPDYTCQTHTITALKTTQFLNEIAKCVIYRRF